MKTHRLIGLIFLSLLCAAPAFSQNCAEFEKLLDETYNFKPSKLTPAERTAKSAKMDVVWEKVKADQKGLLPCLRAAIGSRSTDAFFRFDAGSLLIQYDRSADAKKTLIRVYAEVDFDDIDLRYWMPYIAALGYEGFDVSAAGDAWLRHPDPGYYLPQHGTLKVNKMIGSVIVFGSMDESLATPALAKIASREDHRGREIALWLLLQQATPESFKELQKLNRKGLSEGALAGINNLLTKPALLAKREGAPKTSRAQFLAALKQLTEGKAGAFMDLTPDVPDGEKDVIAVMKEEDIPLIRKARRMMVLSANPHSAEWYESFTKILMAMVWKPDIVRPGPGAAPKGMGEIDK